MASGQLLRWMARCCQREGVNHSCRQLSGVYPQIQFEFVFLSSADFFFREKKTAAREFHSSLCRRALH